MKAFIVIGIMLVATAQGQRPFYAGTRPIGYPELAERFGTEEPPSTTQNLANRFGDDNSTTTTMRLPVDALGDAELIKRIQSWPREKWPFWYLNYVAIEEQRRQRPGNVPITTNTRSSFLPPLSNGSNANNNNINDNRNSNRNWNNRNWNDSRNSRTQS